MKRLILRETCERTYDVDDDEAARIIELYEKGKTAKVIDEFTDIDCYETMTQLFVEGIDETALD